MRVDRPSQTAAWVAVTRGLAGHLPAAVRLVEDPYGAAFAGDGPVGRWLQAQAARPSVPLARLPGASGWFLYMQVRTRVLDDLLRAFLSRGGRQVVLLGAGYDCRALRLGGARYVEVDHPATQARKQRVLARLGAASPATYLPWDFEAREVGALPEALAEVGIELAAPTFTIWEGVTMYLTEPAIDASLRAIARFGGAGSELAMTYFTRAALEAPRPTRRMLAALVGRVGEPWRWGWDPAELPGYLGARGLTLRQDVGLDEAATALLPAGAAARFAADRRVALAGRERIAASSR